MSKKNINDGEITIEFNNEEGTHSVLIVDVSIGQLVMAYQTLKEVIEKKSGMPIDLAVASLSILNEGNKG